VWARSGILPALDFPPAREKINAMRMSTRGVGFSWPKHTSAKSYTAHRLWSGWQVVCSMVSGHWCG